MSSKTMIAALLLPLAAMPCLVFAQDQPKPPAPSPEQMQQVMQGAVRASMNAMLDVAGPMTTAAIDAQTAASAKPETAERIATFKKNLYDALLKKGFTPAQALQIVVATSFPSAAMTAK